MVTENSDQGSRMMADKHAKQIDLLVKDEVVGVAIERETPNAENYDELDCDVKLERLSNQVLAMSVHQSQLWRILSSLHANGIEPYRCVENDTSTGEYELLYIATENAESDLIRYQRILDNAA